MQNACCRCVFFISVEIKPEQESRTRTWGSILEEMTPIRAENDVEPKKSREESCCQAGCWEAMERVRVRNKWIFDPLWGTQEARAMQKRDADANGGFPLALCQKWAKCEQQDAQGRENPRRGAGEQNRGVLERTRIKNRRRGWGHTIRVLEDS